MGFESDERRLEHGGKLDAGNSARYVDGYSDVRASNLDTITMSEYTVVGGIIFQVGTSSYHIDAIGEIGESGIQNYSGVTQNIDISRGVAFLGVAGQDIIYTLNGSTNKQIASYFRFW